MNPLTTKVQHSLSLLLAQKDPESQMRYLISLTRTIPPYPAEKKTDEHLVPGCLVPIWFAYEFDGPFLQLALTSDSQMLKGALAWWVHLYHGESRINLQDYFQHHPLESVIPPLSVFKSANRRLAMTSIMARIVGICS